MGKNVSLEELEAQHRALDTQVRKLESRRRPDDQLQIAMLKKQKLALKDQIARLTPPPSAVSA